VVVRTVTGVRGDDIEVGKWDVYEVQVSFNDTILLSDYSSGVNLDQALLIKKSDRTSITRTIANNVITVTQAGITNIDCLLFVAGVAA
jgi:hypothetical protein